VFLKKCILKVEVSDKKIQKVYRTTTVGDIDFQTEVFFDFFFYKLKKMLTIKIIIHVLT